jgi:hypothetical protein
LKGKNLLVFNKKILNNFNFSLSIKKNVVLLQTDMSATIIN